MLFNGHSDNLSDYPAIVLQLTRGAPREVSQVRHLFRSPHQSTRRPQSGVPDARKQSRAASPARRCRREGRFSGPQAVVNQKNRDPQARLTPADP